MNSNEADRFEASATDREFMLRAMHAADQVRCITSPNPWVGAVLVPMSESGASGSFFDGATEEPGGRHAEIVALDKAGDLANGSTMFVTLEPCSHVGRTGPCVEAIIAAGVARVVVGLTDPDPLVSGSGIQRLRDAGVRVDLGLWASKVEAQLEPYLHHRRTGRPFVICKSAVSTDGRTAAPDGSSRWITSAEARSDGHRLRAESDAICVGAGTIRKDNPSLTVRDWKPPIAPTQRGIDPLRVVLGTAPAGAKVHPCREMSGDLEKILDELGSDGILQLMVEGGAEVAGAFHRAKLIDRYVLYMAPALFGGDDARAMFGGMGAWTMSEVWRGQFVDVARLGPDLKLELSRAPEPVDTASSGG